MQVWIPKYVPGDPLASYRASAAVLHSSHLGAQRNEAMCVLRVASGVTLDPDGHRIPWIDPGWRNIALTRAWRPHTHHLALYGLEVCREYSTRTRADGTRYSDSLAPWFERMAEILPDTGAPAWLGGDAHSRCRSNLLAKPPKYDHDWYRQFGWDDTAGVGMIWCDIAEQYGQRAA